MTRVFLIRHGETEWNRLGIFRGTSEVPLNATGKRQAQALGRYFAPTPPQFIYSSPRARALETAAPVSRAAGSGKTVAGDEGFADIDRGEWEGLSHEQVKAKWPDLYDRWLFEPKDVQFPGGETLEAVQRRAWQAFRRVSGGAAGTVAIVSHHVTLRALLCSLLELDLSHFRQFELAPASVSEARLEHGIWVLHRLNDTRHLAAGGEEIAGAKNKP
jgi:broad specificity phosphatase PhoE